MSRYNRHRRDTNHKPIVDMLRKLGCSVEDTSQVGNGFPDAVVGILGVNFLVEIKDYGKVLSDEQHDWHEAWRGDRPVVLWTPEQAQKWYEDTRRRIINGCKT